ncbi:hypothetical protein GGF41_006793, partial [Coemansia sp. RSA 2531]
MKTITALAALVAIAAAGDGHYEARPAPGSQMAPYGSQPAAAPAHEEHPMAGYQAKPYEAKPEAAPAHEEKPKP